MSVAICLFWTVTACSGLADDVKGMPGVVDVKVTEADGDDLGRPAKLVAVTMRDDATAEQIESVLAEYDEERAGQSVQLVTVTLEGLASSSLSIGQTATRTTESVATLLAVAKEPDVEGIELEVSAEDLDARIDMRAGGLNRVDAMVTRYWDELAATTDSMSRATLIVQADGFLIARDKGSDESLRAKVAVAEKVDRNQPLVGVQISRSQLELRVRSDAEKIAVRQIVRRTPSAESVGRVRVVTESVDLSDAAGRLRETARRVVNKIRHDEYFRFARIEGDELHIGAANMEEALTLEGYFGTGIDPVHRPIAVRFVLDGGSDFGKLAGVNFHLYTASALSEQDEWSRFSVTTRGSGRTAQVDVVARPGVTYGDAAEALAALGAASTVTWTDDRPEITLTPAGPDWREVAIEGDVSDQQRADIIAGWSQGAD
ncbi:hypothetical protein [Nocardioides sp. Root190]|uniref:hypothetical protein n=1 Tax=Nocardioides sp. Root190 TaxID=1736488 RepID=UPI000A744BB1|nr:hypothetical protein [Nocardioides sp. Root190]